MFGASVSIDRVWLHRLGSGVAALVLVATPAATWADESPVATCSAQAREGLARVGAWATAQCDAQTLSFSGVGSTDPSIAELLNRTGAWAAEAYLNAAAASR
jgi:hypothetical protein